MTVTWDIRDPLFQYRAMWLIHALYPWGQFDRIKAGVASLPGPPLVVRASPRAGPIPPLVLARDSGTVGLFITGVTTVQDGLALFVSDSTEAVSYLGVNVPRVVLDGALRIAALLDQAGVGADERLVTVGHSYGGALSLVLTFHLLATGRMRNVSCLTFGSPRPGDVKLAARLDQADTLRINNNGDPVPRFPPHLGEAPTAYSVLPPALTRWWLQWTQPGPGMILDQGGNIREGSLPPLSKPIQDVNLLEWATGLEGFSSPKHAGHHYVTRLRDRLSLLTPSQPPEAPQVAAGVPIHFEVKDTPPAAASAPVSVSSPPLQGAEMALGIPVALTARPQRVGDNWCVVWMNVVVAIGRSRSNASSTSARINAMLRKLVRVNTLNQGGFVDVVNAWINAAVAAGTFAANGAIVAP